MKNKTEFQSIKSTLKDLIEIYGGIKSLTPFVISQVQKDLQWYFHNITDNHLVFARNYMNSRKSKKK
jgi:hypothetical protein